MAYSLVGQICLEQRLYSGLIPGSWSRGCWGSREERECYRWTGGWGGKVAQRPKDTAPELNVAGRVRVWSERKGPRTEGAGCRHVSSVVKYTKHTMYILKCTIQQYFIHSQCYVNTTAIKFQNFFIMPKRNPLPAKESLPFLPTPSAW